MNSDQAKFYSYITLTLANNPEWLETAISAITHAQSATIQKLKIRAAESDRALLNALSLMDKRRMSKELVEMLNLLILRDGIFHASEINVNEPLKDRINGLCELEKSAIIELCNKLGGTNVNKI